MKKRILIFILSLFIISTVFSEELTGLCGFNLGDSLTNFKSSELFSFVQIDKWNDLSRQYGCECYYYEPYLLSSDSKGKTKAYEEINNLKKQYREQHPLKYGGSKVFKITFIFFEEKLICISINLYGKTSYIEKNKLSVSEDDDFFLSKDKENRWFSLQDAVVEKYALSKEKNVENHIALDYQGHIADKDKNLFLNYNSSSVLNRIAYIRAARQVLGMSRYDGTEELVVYRNTFITPLKDKSIDFSVWSYKNEYHQPVITLYDSLGFLEMISKNKQKSIDSLKDEI
jgi:hypothetical protein